MIVAAIVLIFLFVSLTVWGIIELIKDDKDFI